uniref:Uncharacterized protein n=1 Tax=Anguilla anguilla TaxID=7936 RepID=A0A0E9QQJ3_ANGAN
MVVRKKREFKHNQNRLSDPL